MAMFGIRFDFRNPSWAHVDMGERYSAALEMSEWADRLGGVLVGLSEHHFSDDGYLPSPVPLAGAIAARTKDIRIFIAALVGPFHDPLRLAEDLAVLDLLSHGRLDVVISGGYVLGEFAAFGVPLEERPRRMIELFETLRAAWRGQPFQFRGREVRVTPTPHTPGGPKIVMGGSSEGAARRAARIADGFMPSEPYFWDFYVDECERLGKPHPGPFMGGDTRTTWIARDVEQAWEELGPYFLHETNAYGIWQAESGVEGGFHVVEDVDVLRAEGRYRILTPDELATELKAAGPFAFSMLHPMVGGAPPRLAWDMLRLYENEVLPQLSSP
jgi:alkanesulfonate monooxygenase SsuD/methylene tetrahydromethanopterin reductase-like flavin-dependent oxidoreductase (luciferase family)